jgi:hypothetical protein
LTLRPPTQRPCHNRFHHPGTSGILKVTSAAGERYPFQSSGLTIPIDSNCAAAACSKAASTTTVAKAADANVNGAGGTAAGAAALALAGLAAMVL